MSTKGTLLAYLSPHCSVGPADMKKPEVLSQLLFLDSANTEYFDKEGYTRVGTADIEFHPLDVKEMVSGKVEALRKQAESIRAEATAKVTRIEAQVQTLLAIGFDERSVFQKPADEYEIPF